MIFAGAPRHSQAPGGGAWLTLREILKHPLVKKVFFFGSYEGLRLAKALTRTFAVPAESLRNGQFTTLVRDPATRSMTR